MAKQPGSTSPRQHTQEANVLESITKMAAHAVMRHVLVYKI